MRIDLPPLPEGASIEDYHTFVEKLELATVQYWAMHCERLKVGEAPKTTYALGVKLAIEGQRAYYRVDAYATPLDVDDQPVAQIENSVIVAFDLPKSDPPPEWALARFGSQNAVMMAYPFIREAVASMALRLGLPGIIMPMAIAPHGPEETPDEPAE
jgi:CO dehydrogenase/acetyl-CoA synthase delta subunit